MNAIEVVRLCMMRSGATQAGYARESGRTPQNVSDMLHRDDLKAASLADMLAFAGYRLVAVPRDAVLPQGSVAVGESDSAGSL